MRTPLLAAIALAAGQLLLSSSPALAAGGLSCSMSTSNDPTGVVEQDPNLQTGTVQAGPVTVLAAPGQTVSSVTLTCTVQLNNPFHGGGGPAVSATTSGNTSALASTIAYTATAGDNVYLCTRVDWTDTTGPHTTNYDADLATPGVQCAQATSAGGLAESTKHRAGPVTFVVPPSFMDICVWDTDPDPIICVPW